MHTLTVPEYISWKLDTQDLSVSHHAVYCAMRDGRLDWCKEEALKCIKMNQKAFDYIPQQRENKLKNSADGMVIMPNGVEYRKDSIFLYTESQKDK